MAILHHVLMKGILFDLDGVLYSGSQAIAGSADAIRWVNANKIPHMFVTNTTSKPTREILDKLHRFGIEATADQLWTPAKATVRFLKSKNISGPICLILRDSCYEDFSDFEIFQSDAKTIETTLQAVILGDLTSHWTIDKMNLALRVLLSAPDAIFISLGMTRYYLGTDGYCLDVGPMMKALEFASDKTSIVIGKPAAEFFQSAIFALGTTAENTIMIGDDIRSDIGGAQKAGMKGLLVKTGKFRDTDLLDSVKPYAILNSIADLPAWWQAKF